MRKLSAAVVALLAVYLPAGSAVGQESWTADEAAARLGRGVNLGNALEAPNFEGEWGMVIEDEFFATIAAAGFDSVRLPIRWETRAGAADPWTIDATFMARVDELVDLALAADLAIIIDFHHFEDLYSDPGANTPRFIGIWQQIAGHFADAPREVFFELQNEPHGALTTEVWNGILPAALDAVRVQNPDRMVIVGPGFWNSAWELENLELPADPALIGTFHMYEPFQFTHQGAEWVSGSDAWLGTTWEQRTEDTQPILQVMDLAAAWSDATGVPLLMGEFGSYEKADMESRVRFNDYVRTQAELRGFAWSYWEFGAGFGLYDRNTDEWRTGLLNALVPGGVVGFIDDDGSAFEADIEWLATVGVTKGCNPPINDRFCPNAPVTRAEMAAFLNRYLDLPPGTADRFVDTTASVFVDDIDRLAAAGITKGCNPPANDRYCPEQNISRQQMAAFLVRAFELPPGDENSFSDDDGSQFEDAIESLAAAGVTKGCNPPVNDRYCPFDAVTRGQMAAFIHRADSL
jgi:endoglucanase